jgi:hypothetical protein
MLGRIVGAVFIILVVVVVLSQAFPGRRSAPTAPAIATMEWKGTPRATPLSIDQPIDLATCREMQRQMAQQREAGDSAVTLACHRAIAGPAF